MYTWIALFRGINVGGRNVLPMKALVGILESLDFTNVETYIQSGNAVFQSAKRSAGKQAGRLGTQIAEQIETDHGFCPRIHILDLEALTAAIEANPFTEAESEPKSLHCFFLAALPKPGAIGRLEEVRSQTERFHLTDSVFYLHAPGGIGRSKLAAKAEKCFGVPATARNWRTVRKLHEMSETLAGNGGG